MKVEDIIKRKKLQQPEYFQNLLRANRGEPNIKTYWRDSDSQGQFKRRQEAEVSYVRTDTGTHKKIIDHRVKYWEYKSIEYRYNNEGFRTDDDFSDKEEGIVCLGCSFTEGIGLPIEFNWGYLLAKELNKKHYNLGQGALGLDSAFRLLLGYKDSLKFKNVFLLVPPPYRYEWLIGDNELFQPFLEGKHQDFLQWLGQSFGGSTPIKEEHETFFKSFVFGGEHQDTMHCIKNVLSLKGLCADIGANLYIVNSELTRIEREKYSDTGILSRDGHPSSGQQEFYKEQFLKQYYENN